MAAREAAMSGMAAVRATLYNVLMRRNSVYVTTCVVSSYALTNVYLKGTDSLWKSINKGKSWEEVQARLPEKEEEDDD
ncbi:Cytochrome b-c1 complex subunit 9 [Gracilariopsis chorda]|uniref:Complex III subunit 9 n=1 Tax=Gracilariopsis chorda TaxID=448386 RepID=A0A2V3IYU5_9FLOR|nr:Cytochrome b-c1 complex subunit 9 [Gracilariopsis chorda]|eukprot:PXF47233.1 Cytochrome b-c1 complex subunit 9 [Gracilariopsis chorda]